MEKNSKWILFSKTFWTNAVLTTFLAFFMNDGDALKMMTIFDDPEFVQILLLGPGALNVIARYFTSSPIGFLFKGAIGKNIFDSSTFRSNLIMAIPIYLYIYTEYSSGRLGTLGTEALIILGIIPVINILLRARYTNTKVTLLPGFLGKIL
jgi:hypothetical protein